MFFRYVIIFSVFVLIHSTSEVGGMLVTLRCVDPKDKAMALGLISVAIGLLSKSNFSEHFSLTSVQLCLIEIW